jgi:hypothetical protein
MVRREILKLLAICYHKLAIELELKAYILTERIREIMERVSDRVREIAGILREIPSSPELVPVRVPVRVDR